MKTSLLLVVVVLVVAVVIFSSAGAEAFFLRHRSSASHHNNNNNKNSKNKNKSTIVPPPPRPAPSSGNNTRACFILDTIFQLRSDVYSRNITKVLANFAENAKGELLVNQPGQSMKMKSKADFEKMYQAFFAQFNAFRVAFPSVCFVTLNTGNQIAMLNSLFSASTTPTATSATEMQITNDNMYFEVDKKTCLITEYSEIAQNPKYDTPNTTAMTEFVKTYVDNMISKHNLDQLNSSTADSFFLFISHEHPKETEIIPKVFFLNIFTSDWKESTASIYKLQNFVVVQDVVAFELIYIFDFFEDPVSTMIKGFSCRAKLLHAPQNRYGSYVITELSGLEINDYSIWHKR